MALVEIPDDRRRLGAPIVGYLRAHGGRPVFVLIAEVEPARCGSAPCRTSAGAVLARALRRHTDAVVCPLRFRLGAEH